MDSIEATKIVYGRIQQSEPEYVANKIIGYIYLHDHADREMIRLAFGPDKLILNLIQNAKIELGLASKPPVSPPQSPSINQISIWDPPLQVTPFSPASSWPFSSSSQYRLPTNYWHPQLTTEPQRMHNSGCIPIAYSDLISEDSRYQNHTPFMDLDDQLELANAGFSSVPSYFYHPEAALGNMSMIGGPQPLILPEQPVNACHYFHKGLCKHGNSCRYFHGQSFPESYPHMFGSISNDNEDQLFSPGSLEKLEMEIAEILKSRRGYPVSIASLPMIYYEKYGRTLQAEGYLTESQRHGKAGYSLTKLLARLKKSVRLIDRPHGQHSVILVEDAPKYMENICGRNDPGPIVSGSRQIYLTFPAESTFTVEDVSNYFNNFGPVEDVRIPCQQKRMFGFVTFVVADTVNMVLSKGNPHYVCGARVLVKPYREKSKLIDRMYSEKLEPPVYYHSHHADMDSALEARWESSRVLRNVMEKHDQPLELESRRLSELQLSQEPSANQSYFCYSMDELKVSEDGADHSKFPSAERVNYLLDVLNSGSTSDDDPKHSSTDNLDPENDLISQTANLQLQ